ncbi:MAG TPA: hypothetical protein VGP38_03950 [Rubrobacter sp.]|nr:hypothetical protein [Rubrobacter sp.]
MADRDEQRRTLEEVVRLLESARTGPDPDYDPDFDDGRVDSYVVAALSAARTALNIASDREDAAGSAGLER